MRRSARWISAMGTIALVTACETAVDPTTETGPSAQLLINGVANPYITGGANQMAERLSELFVAAQIAQNTATSMLNKVQEIASPFEKTLTPAEAIANLNAIIAQANSTSPSNLTECAKIEVIRQATHLIDLITRASTGGTPVTSYDVTPFPQGAWPWGGCPGPLPPQNVQVSISGGVATVSWTYVATIEQFQVWEVSPAGTEQVIYRLDSDDCGDSTANTCQAGTRVVTFATSEPNVTVRVEACVGLNCTQQTAAIAIPAPITDIVFSAPAGLVLSWTNSAGAEWYEVSKDGQSGVATVYSTTITDADPLTVGSTYTYRVKACNILGCSAAYAESYTVMAPVPPPPPPPPPPPSVCNQGGNNKNKNKCKKNYGNHYGQIKKGKYWGNP